MTKPLKICASVVWNHANRSTKEFKVDEPISNIVKWAEELLDGYSKTKHPVVIYLD